MPTKKESGIFTVAAVRKPKRTGPVEVLFNEKQMIYTFRPSTRVAESGPRDLRRALRKDTPVKAVLDPRRGVIQKITAVPAGDLEGFERATELLEKPERTRRIDLTRVDPTKFNLVDHGLKVPVFRKCKRVVPSYKKAKLIFDFCAAQSCHLGGPFAVTPCIPFQYVRDGCYARAHKMRWVISTRYRHCCEKVFSFANQGSDRLAVRADKWGGCCVTWWYHVAPLIRVKVRLGPWRVVLAMVVDPGMFDKPVLLTTWLAAQENTNCHASANVSAISIQPGSAYAPANYAGTQFSTDPTYAKTDQTLQAYKNLVTCP